MGQQTTNTIALIVPSLPSFTASATSSAATESLAKETKKLAVSVVEDDFVETDAQRETRHAEIKTALEELNKIDPREHLNIVFIGHVDAGKSTTAGQILFLTGGVDDRTIEKYEREAKEKNRESWYMAYIMDTNEEERAKVGKEYTLLPGTNSHLMALHPGILYAG